MDTAPALNEQLGTVARDHFVSKLLNQDERLDFPMGDQALGFREHRILWFLMNVHPEPTWGAVADATRCNVLESAMVTFGIIEMLEARGEIRSVYRDNRRYSRRPARMRITRLGRARFLALEADESAKGDHRD